MTWTAERRKRFMATMKAKRGKRREGGTHRYAVVLLRKAIRNDGANANEMTESQLLTRLALRELETPK